MKIRNIIPVMLLTGMLFILSCSNTITGPEFGPERNIVYVLGGNLFITNPEVSGLKQITFTSSHRAPTWSPDGTKIAFVSDQLGNGFDIFVINIDGTNMTRLTSESSDDLPHPQWSPDGMKIAFTLRDIIYIMNSDGSNISQLTSENAEVIDFMFSPDGSRISYHLNYSALDSVDNNPFAVSDIYHES